MIYFTADLHLGGAERSSNDSMKKEFESKDSRSQILIDNINSRVSANDSLYILGDFINDNKNAEKYIQSINCNNIYIICGNHDGWIHKSNWESCKDKIHILSEVDKIKNNDSILSLYDMYELKSNGYVFYLCHYPGGRRINFSNLPELPDCRCILCGHEHNKSRFDFMAKEAPCKIINVGVSCNNYTPVSIDEIISKLNEGMTAVNAFKYLKENFI